MDPLSMTVIKYISLKFIDQFIKEEGYGRIKKCFFAKKNISMNYRMLFIIQLKYIKSNIQWIKVKQKSCFTIHKFYLKT